MAVKSHNHLFVGVAHNLGHAFKVRIMIQSPAGESVAQIIGPDAPLNARPAQGIMPSSADTAHGASSVVDDPWTAQGRVLRFPAPQQAQNILP